MTGGPSDHGLMTTDAERFDAALHDLFGGGSHETVAKRFGIPQDPNKRENMLRTAGIATNGLAIAGGVHGLAAAMGNDKLASGGKLARGTYKVGQGALKAIKTGEKIIPGAAKVGAWAAKPKNAATLAGAAVGLHAAELGGDFISHHFLSKKPISKASPDGADLSTPGGSKGKLKPINDPRKAYMDTKEQGMPLGPQGQVARMALKSGPKLAEKLRSATPHLKAISQESQTGLRAIHGKVKETIGKDFEFEVEAEIAKFDTDKRQVFGWASIVEKDGQPVVDLQGDYISVEEIEKAAYSYVQKSRKGGNMHERIGDDPRHVSDMIESFIVTPEKKKALNLPDEMPLGWWVGYQVHDDDTWAEIKAGKKTAFSVHGKGKRQDVS